MKLAIWNRLDDKPKLLKRHAELAELNTVVGEYSALLTGVATERADLLVRLSRTELENAELSVSKALFSELQAELNGLRERVSEAEEAILANVVLKRELSRVSTELGDVKSELSTARRQLAAKVKKLEKYEGVEVKHG